MSHGLESQAARVIGVPAEPARLCWSAPPSRRLGIAWASTPGHDAYWSYRVALFALPFADGSFDLVVAYNSLIVITGSYLEPGPWSETQERGGLRMTIENWRYPLQDYSQALP